MNLKKKYRKINRIFLLPLIGLFLIAPPANAGIKDRLRNYLKNLTYSIQRRSFPPALEGARSRGNAGVNVVEQVEVKELKTGLKLEKYSLKGDARRSYGEIVLLRIDTQYFELSLISSQNQWKTLPQWIDEFDFEAAVNAAMFESQGENAGVMVVNGIPCNEKYRYDWSGFFAFAPVEGNHPPVVLREGNGNYRRLKEQYKNIVQGMRMLDDGVPVQWGDPSYHSTAAIGVDHSDNPVFIYSNLFIDVSTLNSILSLPNFNLKSAMYVMGGPRASVCAQDDNGTIEYGDFSQLRSLCPTNCWRVPNLIGIKSKNSD